MNLIDFLKQNTDELTTPAFYFDADEFAGRVNQVKDAIGDIPLTFSIKANPFLLECIPEAVSHVEVCSPGELALCKRHNIPSGKIIYSGVNKGYEDVTEAITYKADILTAESITHAKIISEVCSKLNKSQRVILRLTSGNQFGMSEDDVSYIISHKDDFAGLDIYGIHYFSGTQKSTSSIEKDIRHLDEFLVKVKTDYSFVPEFVELGLGLKVEYYKEPYDEVDFKALEDAVTLLRDFAKRYNVGIELGRFLAATCGVYLTSVCDIKSGGNGSYVICDGGINHLVYYGQNMAMKVPMMEAIKRCAKSDALNLCSDSMRDADALSAGVGVKETYCVCGSLCTVADVLVRAVSLDKLEIGDIIAFYRCGAYSVTEGNALFLSRQIPRVYLYSEDKGLALKRDFVHTDKINCADE